MKNGTNGSPGFPEGAVDDVGHVIDDAFEDRLRPAGARRPVALPDPRKKDQRSAHGDPGRQDRVRVNFPEMGETHVECSPMLSATY